MTPKTREEIEQILAMHPYEMAYALCKLLSKNPDDRTVLECYEALEQLKWLSEKTGGNDNVKTLYLVLEKIARREFKEEMN